jgi:hypothetical protein
VNHVGVHRIENDRGIVAHAQRRRRIDPIPVPSALAQRCVDLGGVFPALATDQHVALREFAQVLRVLQAAAMTRLFGRGAANARRGKESSIDALKIVFLAHPLHQDAADHTSPPDHPNPQHQTRRLWSTLRPARFPPFSMNGRSPIFRSTGAAFPTWRCSRLESRKTRAA